MFVLLVMFRGILFYIVMKIHEHALGFLCVCYRTGVMKSNTSKTYGILYTPVCDVIH